MPSSSPTRRTSTGSGATFPHTTLDGLGRGGRSAAGADGQQRGRPSDDRLRPRPVPGPDAGEQVDRGRLLLREPGPPRARSSEASESTCSASSPTAVSTRTSTMSARCCASLPRRPGSTPSPTVATSHLTRRSTTWPSCRSTGSRRSRAATTRWTATSTGSGRSARSTRSSRARASRQPIRSQAVRSSYERGITDEFIEPITVTAVRGFGRDGHSDLLQLPTRQSTPIEHEARRGRCRYHHDDAVPRRTSTCRSPSPSRRCRRRWPRFSPSTGCASCTSARPRSTLT